MFCLIFAVFSKLSSSGMRRRGHSLMKVGTAVQFAGRYKVLIRQRKVAALDETPMLTQVSHSWTAKSGEGSDFSSSFEMEKQFSGSPGVTGGTVPGSRECSTLTVRQRMTSLMLLITVPLPMQQFNWTKGGKNILGVARKFA